MKVFFEAAVNCLIVHKLSNPFAVGSLIKCTLAAFGNPLGMAPELSIKLMELVNVS
jgi:hypothetical protein